MASEEHAADRAAGEVVYSSDGLPPVAAAIPHIPPVVDDPDRTVLDTGGDVTHAFEVFSGKVYPVTTTTGGGGVRGPSSSSLLLSETPAQRLARLQQEVTELEQDLTTTTASSTTATAAEDGSAEFLTMIATLQTRLSAQAGVAAATKTQQDLTRAIQQHLQDWQANKNASSSATKTEPSEAGVVYELYGGVPTGTSSEPSWEERMLQVERLVGAGGNSSSSTSPSLLGRLEEMETFLKQLDPKALEQASARAKVIRSDLEAASKARNKLASAATVRKEDAQTISALYDQMTQLEGLSSHLPALVARLQQLASLHAQSSSFAVRLTQSEQQVVELQTLVQQLDASVTKVEAGMVANVATMDKNLQQLDERMNKL